MWTMNFQMFKLDLEKAEEPEIKLPTFVGSSKKQESARKTSISALLTMPKSLTVWITINCGKFWKRWEGVWLPLGRSVSLPGGKESACNAGDPGRIPESWRYPGERNDNPLKYSWLGNPKTKKPGGLQSMGLQKAGHNWLTNLPGSSVAFTFNNIDFYISYRSSWFLLLFFTDQYLNQLTISGESSPNGAVQAFHYRHWDGRFVLSQTPLCSGHGLPQSDTYRIHFGAAEAAA